MSEKTPAKPKTTSVTGYFNSNNYRIAIRSAAIGVNVTLLEGEFVKDREGKKINDPRLDAFLLTPGGLAKEIGDPVPIRLLSTESGSGVGITAAPYKPQPMPVKRTSTPNQGMARLPSHALITDRPIPPRPALPAPMGSPGFSGGPVKNPVFRPGVTPPGINPAVRAYNSVAESERLGVIQRAHRPVDGMEIAGDNPNAKAAPYIDEVVRPQRLAPVALPNRGPNVRITTTVGKDLPPPTLDDPDIQYDSGPSGPLQLEPPADLEPVVVDPAKPYICPIDGKAYKNYTSLYRHVKGKYPERLEEVMAPYKSQANAAPGE
jgi:hypothetical protein